MTRPSPLELDRDTMRRYGYAVTDLVADHLAGLRDQPVWRVLSPVEARRRIGGRAPARGRPFEELLAELRDDVLPNNVQEPHPGFMAYVPSSPAYAAVLGDWVAAGWNCFAGAWSVGSGVAQVELTVLGWFAGWLGMPPGTGGLLTSGGSAATVTAMVAARHRVVEEDAARLPRLTVYCSDQAHSSAVRAAWIAGVPRAHVRVLPSDAQFRLVPGALARAIAEDRAAGLVPMMVVASGGTTNTGAIDPLESVADVCAAAGVWMHVDAAFGGFAALVPRGGAALAGIERADSVTLDPHKWLFVPFECGCLLVRDPRRLTDAFRIRPEYLKDIEGDDAEVSFADYGEQLTRYARALKVWLNVEYHGTDALRDAIARGMDLASYAAEIVDGEPLLEALAPAGLGVCCFRAHPSGVDDPAALDALNERLNAAVNADGRWHISSTRLRGRFALRLCPIGHRTRRDDVARVLAYVAELAAREAVHA